MLSTLLPKEDIEVPRTKNRKEPPTDVLLEKLYDASVKRSRQIKKDIKRSLIDSRCMPEWPFVLATVDLQSGIYYAPITNIAEGILVPKYAKTKSSDFLEYIRDIFPVGIGSPGFVEQLSLKLAQKDSDPYIVHFIEMNRLGQYKRCMHYYPNKGTVEQETDWAMLSELSVAELDSRIHNSISSLVSKITRGKDVEWKIYLVLVTLRQEERRHGVLATTGFLFPLDTITEDLMGKFIVDSTRVIMMSLHATLNILQEQERYFQKALRLASKGIIVKLGESADIVKQVSLLQELVKGKSYYIPAVVAEDSTNGEPRLARSPNGLSWYSMTKFSIPQLQDIVTSTRGLQAYEIRSICIAVLRHLEINYWRREFRREQISYRLTMGISIAVSRNAVINAVKRTMDNIARVEKGIPIASSQGMDVVPTKALGSFGRMLKAILPNSENKYDITVKWGRNQPLLECVNPIEILAKLSKTCSAVRETNIDGLRLDCGPEPTCSLHGDAHFANFMCDISVPEDPLIISIDPIQLNPWKPLEGEREQLIAWLKEIVPDTKRLEKGMDDLYLDPTWDLAKLLLSSSVGYTLAYRKAFETSLSHRRSGKASLKLTERGEADVRTLGNVGGMSGSRLVSIDPMIPSDVLNYHELSSIAISSYYANLLLSTEMKSCRESGVAGLTRLWLLTIRHAFSIASKLFPTDIEASVMMFALATRFLNHGFAHIENLILSNRFVDFEDFSRLFVQPLQLSTHIPEF